MEAFATSDQYQLRYGDVDDVAALDETLMDATREIAAALDAAGISYDSPSADFADRLMQACRSMASRAMGSVGGSVPFGATQFSQGAIGLTESFSLGNPYGEVYISKAERKLLGLGTSRIAFAIPGGTE